MSFTSFLLELATHFFNLRAKLLLDATDCSQLAFRVFKLPKLMSVENSAKKFEPKIYLFKSAFSVCSLFLMAITSCAWRACSSPFSCISVSCASSYKQNNMRGINIICIQKHFVPRKILLSNVFTCLERRSAFCLCLISASNWAWSSSSSFCIWSLSFSTL